MVCPGTLPHDLPPNCRMVCPALCRMTCRHPPPSSLRRKVCHTLCGMICRPTPPPSNLRRKVCHTLCRMICRPNPLPWRDFQDLMLTLPWPHQYINTTYAATTPQNLESMCWLFGVRVTCMVRCHPNHSALVKIWNPVVFMFRTLPRKIFALVGRHPLFSKVNGNNGREQSQKLYPKLGTLHPEAKPVLGRNKECRIPLRNHANRQCSTLRVAHILHKNRQPQAMPFSCKENLTAKADSPLQNRRLSFIVDEKSSMAILLEPESSGQNIQSCTATAKNIRRLSCCAQFPHRS